MDLLGFFIGEDWAEKGWGLPVVDSMIKVAKNSRVPI